MSIFLNFNTADDLRDKHLSCRLCQGMYTYAELPFDSGSTEPTVDETLTGATSGDTGVVVNVTLVDGTWAGGNASGFVEIDTLTGEDTEMWTIFEDNETVNGSVGGNDMFTINEPYGEQAGYVKKFGILHPRGDLIKADDGFYYCSAHYDYRFYRKNLDDEKIDIKEGKERGSPD